MIEKKLLSIDIEYLSKETVEPFLNRVSSQSEHYYHKVKANTEKALRELEPQRPPNPESNLNNEVRIAPAIKGKTQPPDFEHNEQFNAVLSPQPAVRPYGVWRPGFTGLISTEWSF